MLFGVKPFFPIKPGFQKVSNKVPWGVTKGPTNSEFVHSLCTGIGCNDYFS